MRKHIGLLVVVWHDAQGPTAAQCCLLLDKNAKAECAQHSTPLGVDVPHLSACMLTG
jgi:hypothetical protein